MPTHMSSGSGTVVEHLIHHTKVEGLSLAATAYAGKESMSQYTSPFLYSGARSSDWTQILNFGMMAGMLYHGATTVDHLFG